MIDFAELRRRNAALNAFVDFDESATFGEGPLAGVTVGVKANVAVRGLPWSAGMALHRQRIAERDAAVVTALREAGAAIVGTLNMEEAALGAKTDNPWFGPTHNPHRIGHTPGGSSGGSGAAVAAGLCDAALGTDTMGSIRIPAAHCGVYGFKPATARVSQDGLEPTDLALDAIGPLARSLELTETVARVISTVGEAPGDGAGAVLVGHGVEVAPEVAQAFAAALAALLQRPAEVRLAHPVGRVRFAGFIEVSKAMAEHLAGADEQGMSDHLKRLIGYGPRRKDADWAEDRAILAETRAAVRGLVAQHGALILPTVPNPPFAHSEAEPAAQADFTCLANIAGLPALSLPIGRTAGGLPIGLQMVGAEGAEAALFARAAALDAALAAYAPPPL